MAVRVVAAATVTVMLLVSVQAETLLKDVCEERKRGMFEDHEVLKTTESNDEWHALLKQAHRDGFSEEIFKHAELAHFVGPIGPPCAHPLVTFGRKNNSVVGCFKDVSKMDADDDGDCVVYSIGLHDDWEFERAIYEKTQCRIEVFDCLAQSVRIPPDIQPRTEFHPICVGEKDEMINGKKFLSWSSLNKMSGHSHHVSYLKMHADGYEHFIIEDILSTGIDMLPTQIAVSLHSFSEDHFHLRHKQFSRHHMVQFFSFMYEKGGYHVIDVSTANDCQGKDCIQVVFAVVECHPHKHTKLEQHELHSAELLFRINYLLSEKFPELK